MSRGRRPSALPRLLGRGAGGLVALVVAVAAALVVVALVTGELPGDDTWSVGPASVAAASAVGAWLLVRRTVRHLTRARPGHGSDAPQEVLRDLARRGARDLGDEDALGLFAEAVLRSFRAAAVEVWRWDASGTGTLVAAVPAVDRPQMTIDPAAAHALGGGGRGAVVGAGWLELWMPSFLEGRAGGELRGVAASHAGQLLGLVLVTRRPDAERFTSEDDVALGELGGRLGLVLHNRDLDTALRETLSDLRRSNADLRASRARLVTAADAERRRIERNLHDGAQQHLVALAVQMQLAADEVTAEPERGPAVLAALRQDLREAIEELRSLAHGIYPPLLRDAGLGEALRAAARRSAGHVSVRAVDIGRHPAEVEAAVYFCCTEAMQNAAKHAPGADVRITVVVRDGALCFEIDDDGPGLPTSPVAHGHGLANMIDRAAALGGEVTISTLRSDHALGTRVAGSIPIARPDDHAGPRPGDHG
jgi:signal transduction histidine kinase